MIWFFDKETTEIPKDNYNNRLGAGKRADPDHSRRAIDYLLVNGIIKEPKGGFVFVLKDTENYA